MKIHICFLIILLAAGQTAFSGAPSTPTTLPLANGDFEMGPFDTVGTVTGWTVSGTGKIDSTTQGATSGSHSAAFGVGGDSQGNVLSQSFFTIPGRVYSLDFEAGVFGVRSGDPLALHIQVIGSSSLLEQFIAPPEAETFNPDRTVFAHYHYTFIADSGVATLQFSDFISGNGVADVELDTVSVAMHVTTGVGTYSLTDLGTLGGTYSYANGINSSARIVGGADVTPFSGSHAFLSAAGGGQLSDLGTLGGRQSTANAVNANGQVTGLSEITVTADINHAFLSAPNGGSLTDLGTLGGDFSAGYAVSDSGQVAGASNVSSNSPVHAFLSGPNGGLPLHDLGTLGGSGSVGNAVNATGQVTGAARSGDSMNHAFLTGPNGGPMDDLGSLGGTEAHGNALNAVGQVAGGSFTTGNAAAHAFVSGPNGRNLIDLAPSGERLSDSKAINSCGQVVGSVTKDTSLPPPPYLCFIYSASGGERGLDSLISPAMGFILTDVKGINDQGQIIGTGSNSGQQRALLLTPNLSIEAGTGNNVTLFWPGSCTGPNVQQATSLLPTGNWQNVTTQPTVVDGTFSFTVSAAANNAPRFYRLTFATSNQTPTAAMASIQPETVRRHRQGRTKE